MKQKFFSLTAVFVLAVSLAGVITATPAFAAFPGKNGKIAFGSNRDGNYEIYTMNADGNNQTNLTNNPASESAPNWSPDGKKITFNSDRDGNNEIYVMNANGSGQTRVTNNSASDVSAGWSPDGTKIVFMSNRDGNNEIYTMNADGSSPTRITTSAGSDRGPRWSPDGTKIVFDTERDVAGKYEIYTMNADGSNQTRLTNNVGIGNINSYGDWSPDGSKITFFTNRDGVGYEIYTMNADGSGPKRLTNNTAPYDWFRPSYSPDGTKITWESNLDGNPEIYTMNADGSGAIKLTSHNTAFSSPDWQPLIGTTTQDPNDPSRIITTIPSNEKYPVLDYTVDSNQTLILDGQLCDVTVASGGILMGTGTACTITVQPGGTIAPGHSPGCLASGNLSLAGTYTAEIGGTTACSQYDQLQVTGTVSVGGTLNVSLPGGFIPTAGNVFTIIANDGTDPVTGTFAGLAEGANVTIGSTVFKISYVGGTGNDVTLTAQAAATVPGAPNTGTAETSLLPTLLLLTTGTVVSLAGLRAYTRRRGYKLSSRA